MLDLFITCTPWVGRLNYLIRHTCSFLEHFVLLSILPRNHFLYTQTQFIWLIRIFVIQVIIKVQELQNQIIWIFTKLQTKMSTESFEKFLKLNASRGGRDKIYRVIQYAMKTNKFSCCSIAFCQSITELFYNS